MTRLLIIPLVLALLSGCAGISARAVTTGSTVLDAGQELIRLNLETRAKWRKVCVDAIDLDIAKARGEGDTAQVQKLVRDNWPPLITEAAIKKIQESAAAGEPVNLPPAVCGAEPE